jgi:hypothetical protein
MTRHARKPSPAMVVACLALLVALGGTSVAAVSALPRGSVGTAQLQNNAVTSIKVRNRSLRAVDFAAGQLPSGPQGPEGPQGSTGAKGAKGDPGSARAWARVNADGSLVSDANVTSVAKLGTGRYCVLLEPGIVDLDKAGALATTNFAAVSVGPLGPQPFASTSPGGCSSGGATGVLVAVRGANDALANGAFTVAVP